MTVDVKVTDFGKALMIKALNNQCPLLFTRMKVGSGVPPEDYSSLEDLVHTELTCHISSIEKGKNCVTLSSEFNNGQIDDAFRITEIGVFALDQDGVSVVASVTGTGITDAQVDHKTFIAKVDGRSGEFDFSYDGSSWSLSGSSVDLSKYGIEVTGTPVANDHVVVNVSIGEESLGSVMFAYVNCAEEPEYVPGRESGKYQEHKLSVVLVVDDAENVTAVISSMAYATVQQLLEHEENRLGRNPHGVTKEDVGLGNVENLAANDLAPTYVQPSSLSELSSGEKMSSLLGKVAKAVSSLIGHVTNRNNPHNVSASQIGAADASHSHSASAITSGVLPVQRGGTGVGLDTSPALLVNLASESTHTPFQSAPRPGVTGILPASHGGTGVGSIAELADLVGGGKRYSRIVIGTSTNGWTAKDCDYLCDGVDDQDEINEAITELGQYSGGSIVFLDGIYQISGFIRVGVADTHIFGFGAAKLLLADGMSIVVTKDNCSLENIKVFGASNSNEHPTSISVHANGFIISKLIAEKTKIVITSCRDALISDSYIGSGNGFNNGINVYQAEQICISGNHFADANSCIYASYVKNLTISANTADDFTEHFACFEQCEDVSVSGNVCRSTKGFEGFGITMRNNNRVIIANNCMMFSEAARFECIKVESGDTALISCNMLRTTPTDGEPYALNVASAATQVHLRSNVFMGKKIQNYYMNGSGSDVSNVNIRIS